MPKMPNFDFFLDNILNYLRNNYKIHCRIKYMCFQIIKTSLYKEFSVKHMQTASEISED
jgi:hypothetical protein